MGTTQEYCRGCQKKKLTAVRLDEVRVLRDDYTTLGVDYQTGTPFALHNCIYHAPLLKEILIG